MLAQVAADEFGTTPDKVTVIMADSMLVPRGHGTGGSRGASIATGAVVEAARKVREKMFTVAARKLEADPADLVLADGEIHVRGMRPSAITFKDLSRASLTIEPGRSWDGEQVLSATAFFAQGKEVDGLVQPRRTVRSDARCDGRGRSRAGDGEAREAVIAYERPSDQPWWSRGSSVVSCARIGGVLYESQMTAWTDPTIMFADHLLPTASDMPSETCRISADAVDTNLPGVKGGPRPESPSGAAVANAVADALAPFGAHVTRPLLKLDRAPRRAGMGGPRRPDARRKSDGGR